MAKLGSIVPLIILLLFVAFIAAVGFIAYSIAHDVGHKTREKLERKNVSFSRDGMKVGVKEVSVEQQEDKTQRYGDIVQLRSSAGLSLSVILTWAFPLDSVLMKVWNSASWSSYDPKVVWSKGSSAAASTPPAADRRNP